MINQKQIEKLIREELKRLKEIDVSDFSSLTKKGNIESDVDAALSSTDKILTSILHALERVEETMQGLDVSMDTVAGALLGRPPEGIEFQQAARGRAARVGRPAGSSREKFGKQ